MPTSKKAATSATLTSWFAWPVEVGLNAAEARNALILRVGQDGVVAAERHAAVLGITGVPTYIFDGQYTISGAQEVGIFARVFDQVAEFASARGVAS